jgi:dihydrofolate reductase
MRKLIAAINMTLDGICDHTTMRIADDAIHQHYTEMLRSAGAILYGRTTYQLMEYWRTVVEQPTDNKADNDFAAAIDNVQKIVFSRTLKNVDWRNTILKKELVKEDVLQLKQKEGKDLFVGSPSMIVQLTQLGLIDEYQLGVQPAIEGSGLQLFKNIKDRVDLKLLKTKPFDSGVIDVYYERVRM